MSNVQLDATSARAIDGSSAPVQETVLDVWQRTMGRKGREPNADLCRMGVGLKRLLRLLDEIEQALGKRIPPGTALRLGTAEAIAEAITTDRWPAPSPSLLLKDGDDRPPLYVIGGAHGIVLEIIALAQAIRHPGKTWGLQPPGLEGETPRFETIQEIAARYVAHLDGNPEVPVNIVGYSYGGEVVCEMARILHARNRRLGLVGLIDTTLAERHWPLRMRAGYLAGRTLSLAQGLVRSPAGGRLEALRSLTRPFVNRAMGAFSYSAAFSHHYEPWLDDRIKVVKDFSLSAHERYVPEPVEFPVVLFRARTSYLVDPVQVWRQRAPRLEVVEVDGDHTTMILPPLVHGLAAEISARLVQPGPADVRSSSVRQSA